MMNKLQLQTIKQVLPQCYGYTTPEIERHNGWIKIGYTERANEETKEKNVRARIKEQVSQSNTKYNLEWFDDAVYANTNESFTDKAFHAYLEKNNIERLRDEESNQLLEWFKILPADSKAMYDDFKENHGVMDTDEASSYTLREEQNRAIAETQSYFKANETNKPEFLWNAKPRFGKTLTAYSLCKTLQAKTILIVTNRPAIANSWYDDYVKYIGTKTGYYFVSEVRALQGKKYVLSREQYASRTDINGCIEFVSLQDLKGSFYFGGSFDKLKEIKDICWDLLIIDESHEGVETYKTEDAFDQINRKYTLHLSGTPFKALARERFENRAIFSWTYADEQKAKRDWDEKSEQENPYASLPQLNLYTYQMSELVEDDIRQGTLIDGEEKEYAFDLNEFFAVNSNGQFKYEDAVDKFLNSLVTMEKFPFSTPELREELKHTFWLLNRVDSVKALAKKLKEHSVFKDYEIVLAAGDGRLSEDEETKASYNKVVEAIKKHDKTITLSVGQLTTGITIPEWTAVLMLSNVKSPALYMQAAFRAQNPCLFNIENNFYRKENAYVFDFDPARTLDIFEQFANDLSPSTVNGRGDIDVVKNNVHELLNFFPVYGEDDDGEMIELDAEKVLVIPRKIHAKEVVKRGFMCNFLFQNISNIFNAPTAAVEIIKKFNPVAEQVLVNEQTKDELSLDDKGEINIPEQQVIGIASDMFGEKIYGSVADDLSQKVEELTKKMEVSKKTDEDPVAELKEEFKSTIQQQLVSVAKDQYGKEMSKSTENAVVRQIEAETNAMLNKKFGNYKIQQKTLEANKNKEVEQLKKEGNIKQVAVVEQKFKEDKKQLQDQFISDMKNNIKNEIVEKAGKIIVQSVEKDKKTKEKNEVEEGIRGHLRGFARTIPSFLMAYGDENTTLETFDTIIPNEVFKEVTDITLDEFRFLRDGGDYVDPETKETKHFDGNLFDPIVFNDSIKEFLRLKDKLSNYFDEDQKEDIFDYIPPQKTNQIFTPKKVVKEMVDNLEQENPGCFDDDTKTYIDLYMKSGLYIAEIVKRLFKSEKMKTKYPKEQERLQHIFEHQVYGCAPSEIIYRIAESFVLGFDKEKKITKHHLKHYDTLPSVQAGTLETDLDEVF